ncbi:hypothetical protein J6590_093468 [Homalodisca vitripennis]|nr:hypothetical protein J6590_093468 [Homalodisca vitripennis]
MDNKISTKVVCLVNDKPQACQRALCLPWRLAVSKRDSDVTQMVTPPYDGRRRAPVSHLSHHPVARRYRLHLRAGANSDKALTYLPLLGPLVGTRAYPALPPDRLKTTMT